MSNELELVEPQGVTDLEITRPPAVVLQEAKKAADALKDVISKKARPVVFNGEQYLEFEDWQTIGRFYGVTVKIAATRPVSFGEVVGFEAEAIVLHTSSGREVSRAEAMCLNDERNWKDKPLFQLRSMAQTRAGSKALRNVLAWVVVLAGYKPTPAEEMDGVFRGKPDIPQVRPPVGHRDLSPKPKEGSIEDARGVPDEYYPRPSKPAADGPQSQEAAPPTEGTQPRRDDPPAQKPESAAEFARRMAEQADDLFVDGFIVNLQPYSGTKRNEKGKRPGQFDVDDGQDNVLLGPVKYFDPSMDLSSGLKRVYYNTSTYNGRTQYECLKVESLEQ